MKGKKAEALLRENEEKFRSIVEQTLVGIYIIQDDRLIYANPGFVKIFGYSQQELLEKLSFEDLIHEDDLEMVSNRYNLRINKEKIQHQYVFKAIHSDGRVLHLEVISSLISYNHAPAVIGTLVDITDRVEEERKLNNAFLEGQEKERLQLGMELHDNVKQILAASGLYIDIASKRIDEPETLFDLLGNIKEFNKEAIEELRRLSHQLAPLVDSESSLQEKISWLIKSLKMSDGFQVDVQIDNFDPPLDNNTQLTLYRILQEQLNNILKHAGATLVTIRMMVRDQELHLEISDNGKGFDPGKIYGGIGLENIRRRTIMLNGKVEFISSPGNGCTVHISVPGF